MINWTIFVLLLSAGANYLLLRENKRIEAERMACQDQWETLNQKIKDGEIIIQLQEAELR